MATRTRTSIDGLLWGELTPGTQVRILLTLIGLPVVVGLYADIEWSATLGSPWAGLAGFIAGALVGVAIRPRKQAVR